MIGTPRVHHRVVASTNARARELAGAGAPHGTLVTADEQTAGRGRQGRSWLAPAGDAVLMSLIVRDLERGAALLPLAAAVAVAEACEALAPDAAASIKWPNDVWLDGRKVAGILLEGRPQEGWAVIGIGLNVGTREFPPELTQIATSLALHGADAQPEEALAELLLRLDRWVVADAGDALAAWRGRDALAGRRISWGAGAGIAAGIADDGGLMVEVDGGGQVTLDAGEVHLAL